MSREPRHDRGFVEAGSLRAFEGCYENCSDPSDGSAVACLSSILWAEAFEYESRPQGIGVRSHGSNRLTVSAFSGGAIVKEAEFTEGEDFYFDGGQIELKRQYLASGASEPGGVFIGVATGRTTIGVDEDGHGRVRQTGSFVGTGFLIIPIAGSGTNVSRIKRNDSLCGS